MAGRFADEFPGAKAEVQLVSKLPESVTVSVARGKPAADLVYLRLFEARELWDAGALAEATAYVRNHKELTPSAYFASANDYRTAGGKLFALPNDANAEMDLGQQPSPGGGGAAPPCGLGRQDLGRPGPLQPGPKKARRRREVRPARATP